MTKTSGLCKLQSLADGLSDGPEKTFSKPFLSRKKTELDFRTSEETRILTNNRKAQNVHLEALAFDVSFRFEM